MRNANMIEKICFNVTPEMHDAVQNLPKSVNLSIVLREFLAGYLKNQSAKEFTTPKVVEQPVVPVSEDDGFTEEIIPRKASKIKSEDDVEEITD